MNSLLGMLNVPYIQQQAQQQTYQQMQQQYHMDQMNEVEKSVKALRDFLDSYDKIHPAYQQTAGGQYCAVFSDYFRKHNMM